MQDLFDVEINQDDTFHSNDSLIKACKNKEVLVCSITDQLDKALINTLPKSIKLIAQFGNGVDNIDVEAASNRSITITNTPSVLTDDTADMAMALILALPRRLSEGARVLTSDNDWQGWSPTWMLGRRLKGKSLGIVGMGRIGTAVAQRAKAFGLNIHYYSRTKRPAEIEKPLNATYWRNLDEMLREVDIISLHTPHNKDSFNLMNKARLKSMKQGAFLINVSRPELIDENALVELIENEHLSGAGLDVFEHQNGINPKLIALAKNNKILLTPHMASATLEGRIEMGEIVIVNIKTFLDGHRPPHRVLPEITG
jgi:glyoxylate reductase